VPPDHHVRVGEAESRLAGPCSDGNGAPHYATTTKPKLAVMFLEMGYSENLESLAAQVEGRYYSEGTEGCEAKRELVNMLRDRGVQFPVIKLGPTALERSFDPCLPDWHPQEWERIVLPRKD
jgi:hypothetical protein